MEQMSLKTVVVIWRTKLRVPSRWRNNKQRTRISQMIKSKRWKLRNTKDRKKPQCTFNKEFQKERGKWMENNFLSSRRKFLWAKLETWDQSWLLTIRQAYFHDWQNFWGPAFNKKILTQFPEKKEKLHKRNKRQTYMILLIYNSKCQKEIQPCPKNTERK